MFVTLHKIYHSSPGVLNFPFHLQSRIVRGLLQPLLVVTAVSSVIAIYETLLEVKLLTCHHLPHIMWACRGDDTLAQFSMCACIMLSVCVPVTQQELQSWTTMSILKFHFT